MSIYRTVGNDDPLQQGEILDECHLLTWEQAQSRALSWEAAESSERVIILTQACDLANAKTSRVQVAVVHPATQLVDEGTLKAKTIRDQLVRHRVYGWYFLPAGGDRMPESIVDLRDIHTVPRPLLEELAAKGKRVYGLQSPYREHLAQHFAVTFSRIGLPEPYETEP